LEELLLIYRHFEELRLKYQGLYLVRWRGVFSVEGMLNFIAEFKGKFLEDEYAIKITLPNNYPIAYPIAEETMGRIPRGFHHYQNGHLCLGTSYATSRTFRESPTLIGFTENSLIPYLYSFSYKAKHGNMPYGELSHGSAGILEYYSDEFGVNNPRTVVEFLKILADSYPVKHIKCPCGSRKSISVCHGKQLDDMLLVQSGTQFRNELLQILKEATTNVKLSPIHNVGSGGGIFDR
jgi:hypothetical protein